MSLSVPALAASASVETRVRQPLSHSFGTNETQQLREGQLVGRMLLQRLATGATGVKKARGATRAEISYALAEINWKSLEISWKSRKSG